VTIEYAVKVDKTSPYFDDPEAVQYFAVHVDPAIPYRKQQGFPAFHNATLVKRDGGDWEPVNGIDLHCIGMRAKHGITKKRALVDGFGWARCTCGWQDENSYLAGLAAPDFEAAATRHMAEVDERIEQFRQLLYSRPLNPIQEACLHTDDITRVEHRNPAHKTWQCRACGLAVHYDVAATPDETLVARGFLYGASIAPLERAPFDNGAQQRDTRDVKEQS